MKDLLTVTRLMTRKDDLGSTEIRRADEATAPGSGEALLRIGRVALTINPVSCRRPRRRSDRSAQGACVHARVKTATVAALQ